MDEVKIVFEYLKQFQIDSSNKVMFDVGGHAGGALYPFAKDGWKVHSFEPNPIMLKKLQENIKRWGLKDVITYSQALGDSEKKDVDFYLSSESTGISSVIPFHATHEKKYKVDIESVNSISSRIGIDKINFLKIDVEGNDYNVLLGVDWKRNDPDVIVVEYEDAKTKVLNITMPDIVNYLITKGYEVKISEWLPIVKYGAEHTWSKFIDQEHMNEYNRQGWGNLIAFKKFRSDLFATSVQKVYQTKINNIKNKMAKVVKAPVVTNLDLFSRAKNKIQNAWKR